MYVEFHIVRDFIGWYFVTEGEPNFRYILAYFQKTKVGLSNRQPVCV
jgi:hypothetical protein